MSNVDLTEPLCHCADERSSICALIQLAAPPFTLVLGNRFGQEVKTFSGTLVCVLLPGDEILDHCWKRTKNPFYTL